MCVLLSARNDINESQSSRRVPQARLTVVPWTRALNCAVGSVSALRNISAQRLLRLTHGARVYGVPTDLSHGQFALDEVGGVTGYPRLNTAWLGSVKLLLSLAAFPRRINKGHCPRTCVD